MDECQNVIDESFLELEKQCSETLNTMGQSESKKSSKKMSGPETKGTSISFGFKKKMYSTNNKKLNAANNNNGNGTKEEQQSATIISNHNVIKAEQNQLIITTGDDNGNSDNNNTGEQKSGDKETTGRTTPRLQPPKRDQMQATAAARGNRFGFRQNVVRPTTGITPRFNEFDNVNNNNTSASSDDKRRSKSATAASRTTVAAAQQPSVKTVHEERSNANANTRPQAVQLSRYTLHSTSLPRPQYPVPVSVTTAPPSYKRSTTFTSFSSNGSSNVNQPQSKLMDTKGAKHAANLYKRGGMMGRRDESLDSGIASHDSTSERQQLYMDSMISRRPRQRSRHFEMVPTGRHKFEIRDLSDFSDNSVVVPLSLPKLPTNRREIVTGGLIRSTNSYNTDNDTDMSISCGSNTRPASMISTSEAESFEEEKVKIDNSYSEKSLKGAVIKEEVLSKNSSPASSKASSKASWFGNAGESMATKNCSSISLSSSDEERRPTPKSTAKKDIDCDEDDLSSMTITADHSSYLNSTLKTSPSKDQKETVNDAFMRQQPKMGSISRKELFIQMDEFKFAQTVDQVKDSALLDDETSPTDSLVSSSDSGDVLMRKVEKSPDDGAMCKRQFDDIKEQDLEDITPELVDLISPVTPGTPTHASNSLSLSDAHDDFLIDDEIADQPALMFNRKHKGSPSHHDDYITSSMNLTSDTPTLKDISVNSHGSLRSLHKLQALKIKTSPAVNRKIMERSGSLDTLSPCDSIASDDLMADFELNSSLDSIDRPGMSHDDLRIASDAESKNSTGTLHGYDSLLKIQQTVHRRHSSRESITSQLPARATRLLNRRLQNNSNSPLSQNGSDSPRSLDSLHSRNTPSKTSLREHLKQRQQLNVHSQLLNSSSEDLVVDKSLRNSMLQDVVCFKKQLVHLRRILQEDEDNLMRSDTLNPFDTNGQIFNIVNGNTCDTEKEITSDKEKKDDENNVVLTNEQMVLLEDQRQELADLRRQVVFLQSQMDDKDRTIRIQQNKLEQYEIDKTKIVDLNLLAQDAKNIETANSATQTERLRPMSMGQDNLTSPSERPKDPTPSVANNKQIPTITVKPSLSKSKTQISSIYTKLSSIKPTNANSTSTANSRNSSIPNYMNPKPVKTTQIGSSQASPTRTLNVANAARSPIKSPKRIPQLVKPSIVNGANKMSSKSLISFLPKSDDSNGNSATSSLSTSSSNSSLNANGNISPVRNFL